MLEHFTIEQLEQELQELYAELEKPHDNDKRQYIQQAIQKRNLKLSRLIPNE